MRPPRRGQLPGGLTKGLSIAKKAQDVRDLQMTDAEEQELGERGQRADSHALRRGAGCRPCTATSASSAWRWRRAARVPNLPWTFVVLDTDGVNAFAAPGGYVHITRGALALIKNEAELAGVLGHEIIHVTEKHTIRAIQKSKAVQMGAAETLSGSSALMEKAVTATYDNIVERGFGRAEENESDEKGVALANKTGYAPNGLVTFLTTLKDRNKESKEKRGLFASHPEMQDRLDRITKQIASQKLHRDGDGAAALREEHHVQAGADHGDRDGRARRGRPDRRRCEGRREEARRKESRRAEEGPIRPEQDAADQRRREEAGAGHRVGRRSRSGSRKGFEGRIESGGRGGEDRRG